MSHGNAYRDHSRKALVHRVRVRTPHQRGAGRYWLFTFTDAWGPCLCDEWGEPVDNTPLADEQHPFWDKFEAWHADHILSRSESRAALRSDDRLEDLNPPSPEASQ